MTLQAKDLGVEFRDRPRSEALAEAVTVYEKHGCFLAKGLLSDKDLGPTRRGVSDLIKAQLGRVDCSAARSRSGPTRFDDGIVELARADRSSVGRIFDACRRLLPVHEVSVDQRLIAISEAMMNTGAIAASDIKALRIDLPGEQKYLFDWHQDFPYVMDSLDAVVFWIPLQDVDETNGALRVAPGTHKLGLQKLTVDDPDNEQNNKQKVMHIADLSFLDRFPQLDMCVAYGDALVFSTLLMHASGPNRSDRARFTLQVRFGNFLHPYAIEKGWPGSMRDGSIFHKIHPEYVVAQSSPPQLQRAS